ncbi:MAG: hypothetical protein KC592_20260, partial [Nitrospira sp.]|nr:hypothetical protein [Nitrospira sp.]
MSNFELIGRKFWKAGILLLLWPMVGEGLLGHVLGQTAEQGDSVAIVANLGGEASISSEERGIPVEGASLQKTIVYGDRLKTGESSILSMLVGEGALVSMDESSEVVLHQDPTLGRLIELVNGRTCISTKDQGKDEQRGLPVKTPNVIVYPKPDTLFSLEISETATHDSYNHAPIQPIRASFERHFHGIATVLAQDLTLAQGETIQVLHGSVEVVSQLPGVTPVVVPAGYRVNVRKGRISQPLEGASVQCQIQDMQKDPQHINNPKEIKNFIAQQQTAQASNLVAALFVPSGQTLDSQKIYADNVILPYTENQEEGLTPEPQGRTPLTITPPLPPGETIPPDTIITPSVPNEDLVQIVGPIPVEINKSTFSLNNSEIDATNNSIALASVSSEGVLRGTSRDPVISLQNSQTTTQSAVEILDASLLEASAPLIAAASTNSALRSSQIMTTRDAVRIDGGQLVASLPTDAALIQLNKSSLSAMGSLFNVSNRGILAVKGNLVSL